MRPSARSRLLLALLPLLLGACLDLPASFTQVDAAEARDLIASGRASLVSALAADEAAASGQGLAWRLQADGTVGLESAPADLPAGDLLVIGSRPDLGMRLAAALARPRNRRVWVFISGSAEERRSLYVVRSPSQENPRGTDS
ncbi:MAG: hypothetical protein JRG76_14120 [Deltaproteobacteria bacterium]|nr:hypothetical protein [Deltaproteobacteria bacterium]MBW2415637.1 hypothetical protein [Deltaproteobacteria bacterium]